MDVTALENSFQSILKPQLTGVTAFRPAKEPKGSPESIIPYATYEIINTNELGAIQKEDIDVDGNQVLYEHYEVIFRVMVVGDNSTKIAHDLSIGLGKQTVTDALFEANLAYSRKSNVRRIPSLVSSNWEERSEIFITCFTVSQATDNIGIIEKVEVNEEFISDSGTTYQDSFIVDLNNP